MEPQHPQCLPAALEEPTAQTATAGRQVLLADTAVQEVDVVEQVAVAVVTAVEQVRVDQATGVAVAVAVLIQ